MDIVGTGILDGPSRNHKVLQGGDVKGTPYG